MCASAPNTDGMNQAAVDSAQLGKDALSWYQKVYQEQAPARDAAASRANAVSDAQLAAMQEATRESKATSDFQDTNLRPLQKSLVDEANNFDTEGKREELAGKAIGDVNAGFDSARAQAERNLTRSGVNVNDGSYAGTVKQLGIAQALASVDAASKARTGATTYAHALKTDAVGALSGLPANSATQAGLALSSGNSSVANAGVPITQAQQAAAQVGAGYGQAMQGTATSGNLYGQIANIQNATNASNAAAFGALGQGVGMFAGGYFKP